MRNTILNRPIALSTAIAVVLGTASAASADWVTIKNDTGNTIVVQETVVVNGKSKRGKPTNLLPGDTIREFIPGPTKKKIEVFDAQNQSLWSGNLNCKDEKQTFSVSIAGGKVTVGPVANSKSAPLPKK